MWSLATYSRYPVAIFLLLQISDLTNAFCRPSDLVESTFSDLAPLRSYTMRSYVYRPDDCKLWLGNLARTTDGVQIQSWLHTQGFRDLAIPASVVLKGGDLL